MLKYGYALGVAMQKSVILPNYAALESATVTADPFVHMVVPYFIPQEELQRLFANLPDIPAGGSFPPSSLEISPLLAQLLKEMEGTTLRNIIARKLNMDLSAAPTMLTIRGKTREKDGRIHTDSVAKRVTVLLYLNPSGEEWQHHKGCLRLLRNDHDIENYVREVQPVDGTLLVFKNGPTAWHGHKRFVSQRYTIQLNYMTQDYIAKIELVRHRLSAISKKVMLSYGLGLS